MKGQRFAPVLALGCTLLVACAGGSVLDAPVGDPYVRGPVESVTHRATASSLLVRAGPGSREMCGIAARVDERTRYLERIAGGELRALSRAQLATGDTVEVYVEGAVMESCPVQGYATAIVRVGGTARGGG